MSTHLAAVGRGNAVASGNVCYKACRLGSQHLRVRASSCVRESPCVRASSCVFVRASPCVRVRARVRVSVPARACLALCVAQLRSLDEAGLVQKHPCARHLCTHTHEKADGRSYACCSSTGVPMNE